MWNIAHPCLSFCCGKTDHGGGSGSRSPILVFSLLLYPIDGDSEYSISDKFVTMSLPRLRPINLDDEHCCPYSWADLYDPLVIAESGVSVGGP